MLILHLYPGFGTLETRYAIFACSSTSFHLSAPLDPKKQILQHILLMIHLKVCPIKVPPVDGCSRILGGPVLKSQPLTFL